MMAAVARETEVESGIRTQNRSRALDRAIAAMADRQHGVLARVQLLDAGLSAGAITRRIAAHRLRPIHRGVYALGHRRLSSDGRMVAALLAAGPGSVISHLAAAEHWGIPATPSRVIDVTGNGGRRGGIRFHEAKLDAREVTTRRGVAVTTVPRTLLDLAGDCPGVLDRALREALYRRLTSPTALNAFIDAHAARRGVTRLRAALGEATEAPGITRSGLEDAFIAFCVEAGLPRPETNVIFRVGDRTIEADCVWREQRLIVEPDGFAAHSSRQSFEADRRRDRALNVAGWRVIRVTDRQLAAERRSLAADLTALLAPAA
jgi:hypothetical protein